MASNGIHSITTLSSTALRSTYSHIPCSSICLAIFSSTAPSICDTTNNNGKIRLICGHIFHAVCISAHFDKSNRCPRCTASSGRGGMGLEEALRKIQAAAEELREVGEGIKRVARGMEMMGRVGDGNKREGMGRAVKKGGKTKTGKRERKNEKDKTKQKERKEKKTAAREKRAGIGGRKEKRKSMGQGSDSEEWEWDTEGEE